MFHTWVLLVMMVLAAAPPAWAQSGGDPPIEGPPVPIAPEAVRRDEQKRVTLRATRVTAMTFDGHLDEPLYREVPAASDFIQQEPREGAAATDKTEVWVFFDETNLYVGARMWESEPDKRVATEMRRDANNLFNNDHIALAFDSFYDRRNGYGMVANALGGMLDFSITNDQPNNNWNGVWAVRTGTFAQGWTAEFRLPFRSFRFRENGHVWGINFRRRTSYNNELTYLVPVRAAWGRPALSRMSIAGAVGGIDVPSKMRNIDLKPYALGSLSTDRRAAVPFANAPDGNLGFDVKWGVRQTLVADFTVNTDFAQVEDDEQQVNLTRFSLQFPEKRDFFLEGADTFNFAASSIGAGSTGGGGGTQGGGQNTSTTPLLFYSRRIGLNDGLTVPIEVGGRLLGRAGPWRFGALNIQTARRVEARANSTNYSVLRVNRDFLRRSRIGMMVTGRSPAAGVLPGVDGGASVAYGSDLTLAPTNDVAIVGYYARSRTPGRDGRDASYRGRFDWNHDRYGVQAEHLAVETNFNPEVGFLRRTAFRRSYGQLRFSPRPRTRNWGPIRKVYYLATVDYITDMANRPESKETQGTIQMDFNNSDSWLVEFGRNYERLVNRFEVGKNLFVPAGEYAFTQIRGTYTLGQQRRLSGGITVGRSGFYDGFLTEITWRGRVELQRQLYLEPTMSWNRVDVPWGRDNTNLLSSRVTYTITPRMFVSALLQYQSRTDTFTTNARLRWEYQPGSELFIVYNDGRTTLSDGFPQVENRSFVVKMTRLLRW